MTTSGIKRSDRGGGAIISQSPEQTRMLGFRLARILGPGDILALEGELGSGKTCFVQGVAAGLEVPDDYVPSPTFVLIREYRGRIPFYHIDLYRLQPGPEVRALGIEEYLEGEGVCAVEWAEKAADLLPGNTIRVTFGFRPGNEREIEILGLKPGEELW